VMSQILVKLCYPSEYCTLPDTYYGKDCRLWAGEVGGHFCKHDAHHGHTGLCGSGLLQHVQGHHCQRCVQ
ncbi:unnamed protein product, partial [Closterium sp. NIES-53]